MDTNSNQCLYGTHISSHNPPLLISGPHTPGQHGLPPGQFVYPELICILDILDFWGSLVILLGFLFKQKYMASFGWVFASSHSLGVFQLKGKNIIMEG